MNYHNLFLASLFFILVGCPKSKTVNYKADLNINRDTIIDLTNNGKSMNDYQNKVIVIRADTIYDIVDKTTISNNEKNVFKLIPDSLINPDQLKSHLNEQQILIPDWNVNENCFYI